MPIRFLQWSLIGGQTLSLFGSSLARFGVGVWLYRETGSVAAFSTIAILSMLPGILISPWAGALVDRWPKARVLIGADVASALGTAAVLLAATTGGPLLAVVYAATALSSLADAFQWPALGTLVPRLVRREELARFNGLLETGRSLSLVGAPALGGLLFAVVGLPGLLAVEIVTCALSCIALLALARIPDASASHGAAATAPAARGRLRDEIMEGVAFIRGHFGLRYLLALFVLLNFFASVAEVLQRPFVLGQLSAEKAGLVDAAFGLGLVSGGLLLGAWGGPRRKASAVAWLAGLEGLLLVALGLQTSFHGLVAATFLKGAILPLINGCSQTVWQIATPLALQGRVFSVRRMLAWITNPVAFALAPAAAAAVGSLGVTIAAMGGALVFVGAGAWLSRKLSPLDALSDPAAVEEKRSGEEELPLTAP